MQQKLEKRKYYEIDNLDLGIVIAFIKKVNYSII